MRRLLLTAAGVLLVAIAALAQGREFFDFGYGRNPTIHNVPYDGQFTFVRVRYETAPGGYWYQGQPAWSHGTPTAEQNLMEIMNAVSALAPQVAGGPVRPGAGHPWRRAFKPHRRDRRPPQLPPPNR